MIMTTILFSYYLVFETGEFVDCNRFYVALSIH